MKKAYMAFLTLMTNFYLYAQDKSTDIKVDINKDTPNNWYASPWVWVVGAAVFIILLVALTSGGSSRRSKSTGEKVTITKTVRRDTDVDPDAV